MDKRKRLAAVSLGRVLVSLSRVLSLTRRTRHHSSVVTEDNCGKPPLVELYPWRIRSGAVVTVALASGDGWRITKVRVPAAAKNGSRLRLPDGASLQVKVLFWRTALHAVVASIVLAGMIAGAVGVSLLLVACWTLLLACRRHTTRATGVVANAGRGRQQPKPRSFAYYLCQFGTLYIIPIGIGLAFYLLLGAYVSLFSGSLTIDQLIRLQQTLENVSSFFADNLKLSELKVLGLLVVVYIASSVLLATRKPRKVNIGIARGLHWLADQYTKYSGPLAAGLATLAAISLFGMSLGAPTTDLYPRIKSHQEGFAEISKTVEAELAEQVTEQLIAKLKNAFPPEYRDALKLPTTLDQSVTTLQGQAATARTFEVTDAAVDQTVQEESARMQRVQDLPGSATVDAPETRPAPGDSTSDQVDAAKRSVAPTRTEAGVEIASEGEKKIVLQVEKLVTEQLTKAVKPITDAIPIVEPLMASFVEALDTSFQDRLEKAYNRVVRALLGNPRTNVHQAAAREALTLVSQTDVTGPVSNAEPRAVDLTHSLQDKITALNDTGARLSQQVDAVVTDLINNLEGTDLGPIEQARTRLRELGPSLTQAHVQKLVTTMRYGNTDVIRHNAAIVVGESPSMYVTPDLRAEARSICGCRG